MEEKIKKDPSRNQRAEANKKIDPKEHKIQELETKVRELTSGWQRTQADFENYRKRMESLKIDWISSANTDLILKILPIMDNFRLANLHTPENLKNDAWTEGIRQIEKQLENIFIQEGLTKIPTKPGDVFDHNFHEAISYEPNDKFRENQIIQVIEEGYKFNDKVLRPVKVRVSKGKNK